MSVPGDPSGADGLSLHISSDWMDGARVVREGAAGAVWIRGQVLGDAGEPIAFAVVETWQADADGRFDHCDDTRGTREEFRGFGRSDTGSGEFAIHTVVPGPNSSSQAPHIDASVYARGMLGPRVTRIYFPEHADAQATDPLLRSVPADRRHTLVATRTADGYRFDVHLGGDRETVFFDLCQGSVQVARSGRAV
jgi:protocatechuate 3,4-dioxygenase alpha subunit